jgi:hypothetical protein
MESQLRRWKTITIVALITMTVLVVAAAAPPQDNGFIQQFAAPKFAAESFLLVGKDGKRTVACTPGTKPVLEFYD